jgi:hypothetical protein
MGEVIKKEFEKYNWGLNYKIIKCSSKLYKINFPKCHIELYLNSMYNSIEFYIYVDEREYTIFDALRFNNLKTGYVFDNHSDMVTYDYLKQYILILNTELLKYINDDFSWCRRADKSLGIN